MSSSGALSSTRVFSHLNGNGIRTHLDEEIKRLKKMDDTLQSALDVSIRIKKKLKDERKLMIHCNWEQFNHY